jgi:hypothetical protein
MTSRSADTNPPPSGDRRKPWNNRRAGRSPRSLEKNAGRSLTLAVLKEVVRDSRVLRRPARSLPEKNADRSLTLAVLKEVL